MLPVSGLREVMLRSFLVEMVLSAWRLRLAAVFTFLGEEAAAVLILTSRPEGWAMKALRLRLRLHLLDGRSGMCCE